MYVYDIFDITISVFSVRYNLHENKRPLQLVNWATVCIACEVYCKVQNVARMIQQTFVGTSNTIIAAEC